MFLVYAFDKVNTVPGYLIENLIDSIIGMSDLYDEYEIGA